MQRLLFACLAGAAGLVLLNGCGNVQLGREKPEPSSGPAHWRGTEKEPAGDGPGGVFSALIYGFGGEIDPNVDPPAFYRHQYTLWRRDHKNLSRQIARNTRGTQELLRQVVGSLSGMKEMLEKEEQREELTKLQLRYESIARKSTQGFKPAAFSLALDKIKWKVEKEYKPGAEGLVYRPRGYFQQREQQEFAPPEEEF